MYMLVIKKLKGRKKGHGFTLSEDARRRAREHLKSVGIDVDRLPHLVWPENAVSAYHKHMYAPWEFKYKSDILQEKKEKMERNIRRKRESDCMQRTPLYVWVFWCPGAFGFAFKGWWLYLIGKNIRIGNFRGEMSDDVISRIMELFPIERDLFGPPDLDKWMKKFVKQYSRGKWCRKPQGKAPIWAEIKGGKLMTIISRAEWPNPGAPGLKGKI